jgi:hypothetical protein
VVLIVSHVLAIDIKMIIVMDILLLQLETADGIVVKYGRVVLVNAEIITKIAAINPDNL